MALPVRYAVLAAVALLVLAPGTGAGEVPVPRKAGKPRPVADFLTGTVPDVKSSEEAWKKARELERAKGRPERDRLTAALPYYLLVVKLGVRVGHRDANAPVAAARIGEIVEKYAATDAERILAGKFYMIAAHLDLGSDVWIKAEKHYVTAGRGLAFAGLLARLADACESRAERLILAGPDGRKKADRLRIFAGVVRKRAEALDKEHAPAAEMEDRKRAGLFSGLRVSGWARLRDNSSLDQHRVVDADDLKQVLIHLEVALPVGDHLLFASGQALVEHAASDDEHDAEPVEAYAELHFGPWDLRIGQQIFSWGSGTLFNPTDNVGRWRAVDPFDTQRRGVPAALFRYNLGSTSIEGIYLPAFRRTELPKVGQRFFIYHPRKIDNPFGPGELDVRYVGDDYSQEPEESFFETQQYAVRLRTTIRTWDIALTYFQGYENIALITAAPVSLDLVAGTADLEARYVFPKERVCGLDVAGTIGKLGLHFEGAYFSVKATDEDVGVGDEDYAAYIVGLDYSFEDLIASHDVRLSVEYAGEIKDKEDDRIYINRIYRNSLLTRVKYTVDYKLSFEVRQYLNFDERDGRTNVEAEYRWSDRLSFRGGADFFTGPEDTFFGTYDDNDRFYLEVKVSF